LSKPVTIEVPSSEWKDLGSENVTYFIVAHELTKPSRFPCYKNIFLKFRVTNVHEFDLILAHANACADEGHQVLLMPEWDISPEALGEVMRKAFGRVRSGVRLMPPVQQLLRID
jgi:hypothetical protein